jgi:hypothetical protein
MKIYSIHKHQTPKQKINFIQTLHQEVNQQNQQNSTQIMNYHTTTIDNRQTIDKLIINSNETLSDSNNDDEQNDDVIVNVNSINHIIEHN